MKYLHQDAKISPCGRYRYRLSRVWDIHNPALVWCMLNPSTADGNADDATIRRVVGFSGLWGYGGVVIVNLFAFRATDPRKLKQNVDIVGPLNDEYISKVSANQQVVAAWGANAISSREHQVANLIWQVGGRLSCLGLTKDRHPLHPLRLPKTSTLQFYVP